MKKFNTLVVSAFAGTGKTTLCSNDNLEVLDMDSALFDKADFPENYMRELRHELDKGEYRYIFVSTHASMRAAMAKESINFVLVYPRHELKEEYRKRYIERNSPHEFVESIMKNWEDMLDNCAAQEDCIHTILESGEHLEDRFLMSAKTKAQASSSRYSLTIDGHSDLSSQKDSGDGSEDDEAKEKKEKEKLKKTLDKAEEVIDKQADDQAEGKGEKEGGGGESGESGEEGGDDVDFGGDDEDADKDPYADIKIPGEGEDDDDDSDDDSEDDDDDSDSEGDSDEDEDDLDEGDDGDEEDGDEKATASTRIPRDTYAEGRGFVVVYYPGLISDQMIAQASGRYDVIKATASTIQEGQANMTFVEYEKGLLGRLKEAGQRYVNIYPEHNDKIAYVAEMIKSKWDDIKVAEIVGDWEQDITAMRLDNVPSMEVKRGLKNLMEILLELGEKTNKER